jgi:hypothetical protein
VDGKRVNIDDPEDDGIFVTEVCFKSYPSFFLNNYFLFEGKRW